MWLVLAACSAFLNATTASVSKIILKNSNPYIVGLLRLLICIPLLLLILFFIDIPRLEPTFFWTVLILIPFEVSALVLFLKAIKISPLSLTMPFLALTPVFLILTGRIILAEQISSKGIFGISLVAIGSYMLNINRLDRGILEPIRSIFSERGSFYMLIVALIFSITAPLGKRAVIHSSPLFFAAIYAPIISLGFIPLALNSYRQGTVDLPLIKRQWKLFLLAGLLFCLSIVFHFLALSLAKAAYMVSVKRLSVIFAVVYGGLIFKEDYIFIRLLAASLMVFGVLLISLA